MFFKFPSGVTKPILFCVMLSTLTLAACSDSNDDDNRVSPMDDPEAPVVANPDVPVVADPDVPVVADPDVPVVADPDVPVVADPDVLEIDDPDNDDRPGLAVTGLNGIPAEQLTSPWLVNTTLFRIPMFNNEVNSATVDLQQYNDTFQVSTHIDFYTRELDTCRFTDIVNPGEPVDDTRVFISGGNLLTINAGNGPWLTISDGGLNPGRYDSDFNATPGTPGPLPADATLSIPGADFPNVAAYPLSESTLAPVRITPQFGELSAADVAAPFTWVPGPNVPGGYVAIVAEASDSNGGFLGFPFICSVVDDGEFNLPQDAIDEFGTTDLTITARYERRIERVDFIDGIVFHFRSDLTE